MGVNVDVLSKLMPNILTIAVQLCATAVLFLLMKRFAWDPVRKILEERSKYEQERLTDAEDLRREQIQLREEVEQQLSDASKQAIQTIKGAREEGERLRDSLVNEGKQRSQQLVDEAQKDIELQKAKMMEELHKDIVNVAINTTSKMLAEQVDEKSDKRIVEGFIKEVAKK